MIPSFEINQDDLNRLFRKLDDATKTSVAIRSLELGGLLLAGWSKKNRLSGPRPNILGVKTGRLRSSISASRVHVQGDTYEVRVGTNVVYGPIHEYGGQRGKGFMRARPFLRPSIENQDNRKQILDILTRNINEALARA